MSYNCNICKKSYSSYKSLWNHNKKKHTLNINPNLTINNLKLDNNYQCRYCKNIYKFAQGRWRHEKNCNNNKIVKIQKENKKIKIEMKELKTIITKLSKDTPVINNVIIDNNNTNDNLIKPVKLEELTSLTLNNITIFSRNNDNYINATQLCQAGNKQFNDWFQLNITKELINDIINDMRIPLSELIDIKKNNNSNFIEEYWIHPDLAIQLAQWISPTFLLQVSKWIRTLLTNGNLLINIKLEEANKEINLKNHKIQLLKDSFIKKQRRENYPDKNIIYMITTDDNKKKRTYIIGKTINLKKRLSNYNKTAEHEVIYYETCNNEEDMNVIEIMIINKLKKYKEIANRDRFILPLEKDITFFIKIINNCINFVTEINKKNENNIKL